ncbi:MAG: hypothetical protein V1930_00365 [Pseudomonadota bacterium]
MDIKERSGDLKENLKKIAKETEIRLAKSILLWKYKKEGKPIPNDGEVELKTKVFTSQAHNVISRRGKNIWNEIKRAYRQEDKKGK